MNSNNKLDSFEERIKKKKFLYYEPCFFLSFKMKRPVNLKMEGNENSFGIILGAKHFTKTRAGDGVGWCILSLAP